MLLRFFELLYHVGGGHIADVSQVHAVSLFSLHPEAQCIFETSAISPTIRRKNKHG
jgi:hypothetical protein